MANSRPFLDFLREHRGGQSHDELSDALQSLVAAVAEERKSGTLTFTISIAPASQNSDALAVSDRIKLVAPKPRRSESIFFVSPENNLVREDPRQARMDLRDINAARTARDIA